MKRLRPLSTFVILVVGVALAGSAVPSFAQEGFGWTISASPTDPFDLSVPFTPGVATYYLWLECCSLPVADPGLSAAEFALVASGPNVILAFTPASGFLNAGTATDLQLGVGGCPCGPVLAGNILVLNNAPGSYCIGPALNGNLLGVDCETPPQTHPVNWKGLDTGGGPCSNVNGSVLCGPVDCICWYCSPAGCTSYIGSCIGCQGPEICDDCPTPVAPNSWGRVKADYR